MPEQITDTRYSTRATLCGILAILLWSSLIAVARTVVEDVGAISSAAYANLLAGLLACAVAARRGKFAPMLRAGRRELLACGTLFVVYNLALYLALERARTHEEVIAVALINYLWPALVLALSIPLLGVRAQPVVIPGLLIAILGSGLARVNGADSLRLMVGTLVADPLPAACALVAAVTWALYSNLTRRWAESMPVSALPLFLFMTGVVLLVLRSLTPGAHPERWTTSTVLQLLYLALFPTFFAYLLWEIAMREGNTVVVATASFLTPLLSTGISALVLHVVPGWPMWAGCALVIAGALICRYACKSDDAPAVARAEALPS